MACGYWSDASFLSSCASGCASETSTVHGCEARSTYCGLTRQREPGHDVISPPAEALAHSPSMRCVCQPASAVGSRQTCTLLKPCTKSAHAIQKEPSRGCPPRPLAMPGWFCQSAAPTPHAPRQTGAGLPSAILA